MISLKVRIPSIFDFLCCAALNILRVFDQFVFYDHPCMMKEILLAPLSKIESKKKRNVILAHKMFKKSTGDILQKLRHVMVDVHVTKGRIAAYIVPGRDAHNTEYIAPRYTRMTFISGFTGYTGTCVVTETQACLWTDPNLYPQAIRQIDENWTLMKTTSLHTWLIETLPPGSNVGVDPQLLSYDTWVFLDRRIKMGRLRLIPIQRNLVDIIWSNRPNPSVAPLVPLIRKFSGKKIKEKFTEVRRMMKRRKCSILVLSALDEIAWLLNLRGSDVPFHPFFFAYLLVEEKSFVLFLEGARITKEVRSHLANEAKTKFFIDFYDNVSKNLQQKCIISDGFIWCPGDTSYALTSVVPPKKLLIRGSPVGLKKIVKNPIEIIGMQEAALKDSTAMCCTLHWIQQNMMDGSVTERSVSAKLEEFRRLTDNYAGKCFETICSVGTHTSIRHFYDSALEVDFQVTDKDLMILDCGGQYLEGTTDICRTCHFGLPTQHQKEMFTLLVKGHIALARAVFPGGTKGASIDTYARRFLWEKGLDFLHEVGHGIGAYLSAHEGPISIGKKTHRDDPGFSAGMFMTNEPGYYEEGIFGLQIGNMMLSVIYDGDNENDSRNLYLSFKVITLIPIQLNMVDFSLLSYGEKMWLNEYHMQCRQKLIPLLEKLGKHEVAQWVLEETARITL